MTAHTVNQRATSWRWLLYRLYASLMVTVVVVAGAWYWLSNTA